MIAVQKGLFEPVGVLLLAALAGCAATPAMKAEAVPQAAMQGSGMVIGTLSYQYVDAATRHSDASWVVHFERVDQAAAKQSPAADYTLIVDVDPVSRSGVFTGALPAGVYAFRDAASADRHYAAGAMKMPFEVQAGAVQDAGHYALNPLNSN